MKKDPKAEQEVSGKLRWNNNGREGQRPWKASRLFRHTASFNLPSPFRQGLRDPPVLRAGTKGVCHQARLVSFKKTI